MNETWWVGQNELDNDQRSIISLPIDKSFLVTGPPGSGKTNLLLLRANYLYLAGYRNIAIVTFTRSLREFIANGSSMYEFPSTKIMTFREWQSDFFRQYGVSFEPSNDFEQNRELFFSKMNSLTKKLELTKIFDAILLDEAQDYSPKEINLFSTLSERLFCVADERQKIYNGKDSIETIKNCVDEDYSLRYHYRNGVKICRVADEIAKKWQGYQPLAETSNYDEKTNPSTVDSVKCQSIKEQADKILSRLRTQRVAFPDELIGILCPTKTTMNNLWEIIKGSEHSDDAFLLHSSVNDSFPLNKHIIVSTFHTAKGLEFRALHLAACDELKTSFFQNNRRITFTAVTRAKTALSVYHCDDLYGYFDAAIQLLEPALQPPSLDKVFGGSK